MVCSITLNLDPSVDHEALMEALAIINARPLNKLKRNDRWLANTKYFNEPRALLHFLMKSATDGDRIEVSELRTQAQRRALTDRRNQHQDVG